MAFWGINLAAEKLEHDIESLKKFLNRFMQWIEDEAKQPDDRNIFLIAYGGRTRRVVESALRSLSNALEACAAMERDSTHLLKNEITILRRSKPKPGWVSTALQEDFVINTELRKNAEIIIREYKSIIEDFTIDLFDFEGHDNLHVAAKAKLLRNLQRIFLAMLAREKKGMESESRELEQLEAQIKQP